MLLSYLYTITLLLYFFLPQAGPLYAHLIGPIGVYFLLRFCLYYIFDIELAKANDYVFSLDQKGINDSRIVGTLQLEQKMDPDYFFREVERTIFSFKQYSKLRKRLVSFLWVHFWVNYQRFNISDHIVCIKEPLNTEEQLNNFMSAHMTTLPFQEGKPMWMIYFFPSFSQRKSAVMLKIHHCYGDGVSLLSLVLNLSKDRDFKMVKLTQPTCMEKTLIYFLGVFKFVKTLLRVLCLNRDDNYFHRKGLKLTGVKKIGRSSQYNLNELKRLAKKFNATINDLLVTLILEGLKRYSLKWHNQNLEQLLIMIPVSLRPLPGPGEVIEVANEVMAIFMQIPLTTTPIKGTEGRVFKELIHYRDFLRKHKGSYESFVEMYITGFIGLFLPLWLFKYLLLPTASKPSCFVSTVPGPMNQVKFLGNPIESTSFFTNIIGDVALGFSSFSYNGTVQVSLITDEATGIQPEEYLKELDQFVSECMSSYM